MMLMEELKLRADERSAQQAAERRVVWQEFIRRQAAQDTSEALSPEEVLDRLDQLGRTVDELQQALDLFATREKLAGQVADGDRARQELMDTQAEIDQAEAELNSARAKFESVIVPLRERNQAAQGAVEAANYARRDLVTGAGPESRKVVVEPFEAEAAELSKRREAAERELRGLAEWVSVVESRGERASDHDKQELPNGIRRLSELRELMAELRTETEDLSARRIEAERQLLDPAAIA